MSLYLCLLLILNTLNPVNPDVITSQREKRRRYIKLTLLMVQ